MSQLHQVQYDLRVFGANNNPHKEGTPEHLEYEDTWNQEIDKYLIQCELEQRERVA